MDSRLLGTFTLFLVLAASSTAGADAIDPPPECPPGARGVSSHAGTRCVPATCATDADCGNGVDDYQYRGWGGAVCRPYRVCSRTSSVPPAGRRAFGSNATPHDEQLVMSTCDVAARCTGDEGPRPPTVGTLAPGPATCLDATYCVPPSSPTPPPSPPGTASPPAGTASPETTSEPRALGCSAAAGAGPAAPGVALLVLAFFITRRMKAR